MMELRTIPFIEDTGYRIDRTGQVHSLKEQKRGRARGQASFKWVACEPLTIERAQDFARVSAGYPSGFSLVLDTTEVIITLHADGSTTEREVPYRAAERVRHNPNDPPERAFWKGGSDPASGDLANNWFSIATADGSKFVFHGPSVAAAIFR